MPSFVRSAGFFEFSKCCVDEAVMLHLSITELTCLRSCALEIAPATSRGQWLTLFDISIHVMNEEYEHALTKMNPDHSGMPPSVEKCYTVLVGWRRLDDDLIVFLDQSNEYSARMAE